MKKCGKMLTAGLLCLAMTTMTVMPSIAAPAYTPVPGGQTAIKKYLVMDKDANVPEYTPGFTMEAGAAAAATEDTPAIYAGINPLKVQITAPAFHAGDATYETAQPGDSIVLDGRKYASGEIGLDFSQVSFPEPGVYRYILKETDAATGSAITNDANASRTLDVYVTDKDDDSNTLQVESYVLHKDAGTGLLVANTTDPTQPADGKSSGFTNEYATHNLTFMKKVEGNQASRDKWFKVTLTIEGAVSGTKYTVDLGQAKGSTGAAVNAATDPGYADKTNPAEITAGDDGTVTKDFYVQHGDTITVKGLAEGTKYTLTETEEDYAPSAAVTGGDDAAVSQDGNSVTDTTGITADTTVTFTNTKTGSIPTGVLMSVAPYAVIGGVVLAGIVVLSLRKRRT